MLVVPAYDHSAEAPNEIENAKGIRSPGHKISNEMQPIVVAKANLVEQVFQLQQASMDISDNDGSWHGALHRKGQDFSPTPKGAPIAPPGC